MKPSLVPGLLFSKRILIDEERCISFMGRENMVYATPWMVCDVEHGSHVRFVVDTAKSRERLAAKRARLDVRIK